MAAADRNSLLIRRGAKRITSRLALTRGLLKGFDTIPTGTGTGTGAMMVTIPLSPLLSTICNRIVLPASK